MKLSTAYYSLFHPALITFVIPQDISSPYNLGRGPRLKCCATIRKIAGSIPAGVSGPGVDAASNRNEYQEYLLGG